MPLSACSSLCRRDSDCVWLNNCREISKIDRNKREHTHDTDMWNRHNVHKMFINIYRNPKTRNWFRHETFIHFFEFKGFSTRGERERDTHTIFLCWLLLHRQLSTQPTRGARSAQVRLASPSSESRLSRSEAGTQLTDYSQISAHASGAWRHPHPLVQFLSVIFILTSLNDTSSPGAREHLR